MKSLAVFLYSLLLGLLGAIVILCLVLGPFALIAISH